MTTLRTAAQQALAFTMRDFASLRDFEAARAVLHDNLRAALAQQAEPVEPVARIRTWHKNGEQHAELRVWEDGIEGLPDGEHLLYTALAQQAEPVEPVAYRHLHEDGWEYHDAPTGEDCAECQALYTTPPQRKPLTDEEIQAAWDSVDMRHPRGNETRIAFARAVERAHGIGGSNG